MRTYAEVLAALPEADIVDYLAYPHPQLVIFQDNIPGDVRTVTRVYLDQPAAYRSRLTGYDAKRNRWSNHVEYETRTAFPNRKGLKAIQDWLRSKSMEARGHPCAAQLTVYKNKAEKLQTT